MRSVPGSINGVGNHVSKAIHYFILSLVVIVRGIYFTHEDRVSVL